MERLEGLLEPRTAAPVQQVEVDALDAQALEAALAGGDRAGARGIVRIDLADDEGLVAPAGDRLADDLLGAAVAVHLGGVDHRDSRDRGRTSGRRVRRRAAGALSPMRQVPRPRTGMAAPEGSLQERIRNIPRLQRRGDSLS